LSYRSKWRSITDSNREYCLDRAALYHFTNRPVVASNGFEPSFVIGKITVLPLDDEAIGTGKGIQTHVSGLRGQRPRSLDDSSIGAVRENRTLISTLARSHSTIELLLHGAEHRIRTDTRDLEGPCTTIILIPRLSDEYELSRTLKVFTQYFQLFVYLRVSTNVVSSLRCYHMFTLECCLII
jgi:hypothetical protein